MIGIDCIPRLRMQKLLFVVIGTPSLVGVSAGGDLHWTEQDIVEQEYSQRLQGRSAQLCRTLQFHTIAQI